MDAIIELIFVGCIFAFGYFLIKVREMYEEVTKDDQSNTDQ